VGYFSNGAEGLDYEATWCERCVNGPDNSGSMCPIWLLHHEWNTDSCRYGWPSTTDPEVKADSLAKKAALDFFIPCIGGIYNGGCRMFKAKDDEWKGREDELRATHREMVLKAHPDMRDKGAHHA